MILAWSNLKMRWWMAPLACVLACIILVGAGALHRHQRRSTARRPAPTPALDRAAASIRFEVDSWGEGSGLAPEYLHALSAMNYVQNTIGHSRYALLRKRQQLPATLSAETCLTLNAGICGNHVDTFDEILARCALPVKRRSAEFYLHDEVGGGNCSHVVAEVYYKNGWRMFDVSSGTFFLRRGAKTQDDLLGAEEIRELVKRGESWRDLAVANTASVWGRQLANSKSDPYRYLAWLETDLVVGRTGTIHLRGDTSRTKYCLDNMPTLIGYFEDYCGNIGNVKMSLDADLLKAGPQGKLIITIQDVGRPEGNVYLAVKSPTQLLQYIRLSELTRDQCLEIDVRDRTDDLLLEIDSDTGLGSALVSEIRVR